MTIISTTTFTAPPLSQSLFEQMACPEFYVESNVRGVRMPANVHSERGSEIHHAMAQYIRHCVKARVPADWAEFDRITKAAGPVAGPILDGLRDSYAVDFDYVLATEMRLYLTADFQVSLNPNTAAYAGTPDVVIAVGDIDGGDRVKIQDFKSHPKPFAADTFQSMFYPFILMAQDPSVQVVEFELVFVRYKNCRRSVVWTREQMPEMMRQVERARERQLRLHTQAIEQSEWYAAMDEHRKPQGAGAVFLGAPEAIPGNHCAYCPHLAKGTCPVRELNPHANMTPSDRLLFAEWLRQQEKLNTEVLKAHVDAHGPVTAEDGNGKRLEASYQPTESAWFPLLPTVNLLREWGEVVPADNPFEWKDLRVGSTQLKSKLKAAKRADLHQRMFDEVVVKTTDVDFKIGLAADEEGEE